MRVGSLGVFPLVFDEGIQGVLPFDGRCTSSKKDHATGSGPPSSTCVASLAPGRGLLPVGDHVQRGLGVTRLDVDQEALAIGARAVEEAVARWHINDGTEIKQCLGSSWLEITAWPGLHGNLHQPVGRGTDFQKEQLLAVAPPAWLSVSSLAGRDLPAARPGRKGTDV